MDLASLIASIASIPGIGPYMVYISLALTLAVTLCSALATIMPSTNKTTGFYALLYRIVNWVALSFGHAKNLSAPSSAGIVGGPGAIENPMVAVRAVQADGLGPVMNIQPPIKAAAAIVLVLAFSMSVSACSPNAVSSAAAPVLSATTADVARAVTLYGIVKGEAQVAALADPQLAPYINAAIAKADPIATALQSGTPSAVAIGTSAATLIDQAVALETATAQAIKVVPASAVK